MKKYILSTIVLLLGMTSMLAPATVLAADSCNSGSTSSSKAAIQGGVDCVGGSNSNPQQATDSLNNTITQVINILSVVGGIIAVVMIIVAGYRYITASGNESSIASAKNTLLYAIIGLVIIALAQVIVQFVLKKTTE